MLGAAGLGAALAVLLAATQVSGGDGREPPRLLTTGTPGFPDPRGDPPAPADHVAAAAAGQWADFPAGRGRRPIVLVGPVSHRPGYRLTITDVRLGSRPYHTDRGRVRLPAWIVTFRGGTYGPSSILAVTPSAVRGYRPLEGPHTIDRVHVAADGRTLTVHFVGARAGTGPCTADYAGGLEESAGGVGVVVVVKPRRVRPTRPVTCRAVGYPREVTLRLQEPLGDRVAFDGQTAAPLLAGERPSVRVGERGEVQPTPRVGGLTEPFAGAVRRLRRGGCRG